MLLTVLNTKLTLYGQDNKSYQQLYEYPWAKHNDFVEDVLT